MDSNSNSSSPRNDLKTKMEFAVEMNSPCCADKVQDVLNKLEGVEIVSVNHKSQRMVIESFIAAETVKNAVEKQTGMSTVVLGQGSEGAGVAAISFGNHGILGLLRLVQNQSSCIIEGSLDSLPSKRPLYLSVHETGNVSDGCDGCGDLLSSGQEFNGILGQLAADNDKTSEFRLSTSGVKLSDMIGRCVVVHEGEREAVVEGRSTRLACGIVARASGLFQNSKRFCACDGVSIWEQKNSERSDKACH